MKKAKLVKTNKVEKKEVEKDSYSLKKLLTIIIILVMVLGIFYFITTLVVEPVEEVNTNNEITEIDSKKITLNNLLNRKEKEYYVLATRKTKNKEANYIELYNNYINKYSAKEDSLIFYSVNLDDALNKNYLSDKLNITDNIEEIKINDDVLFKIKEGKIDKYFVGSSKIIKALSGM